MSEFKKKQTQSPRSPLFVVLPVTAYREVLLSCRRGPVQEGRENDVSLARPRESPGGQHGRATVLQYVANLARETLPREWFLQQRAFLLENVAQRDGELRVARHVKCSDPRIERDQLVRQLGAVHAGHHDVSQEEVNLPGSLLSNFDSLDCVGRFEDGVTFLSKHLQD